MLTANLLDIVAYYRLRQHRNMWSDHLMMDLIYLLNDWD